MHRILAFVSIQAEDLDLGMLLQALSNLHVMSQTEKHNNMLPRTPLKHWI